MTVRTNERLPLYGGGTASGCTTVDAPLEHDDPPVVDLDQVSQRLRPNGVALPERHGVELPLAGGAEHVHHPGEDTLFGHHRVDLGP